MIFDKNLMFFDGDAGAATASSSIDLGSSGIHEVLDIYFGGNGLTAGTNLVIEDSDDDSTFATLMDVTVDYTILNEGYTVRLPPNARQYIRITVTAGAGGTMTAGIVKDTQLGY